MGCRLRHKESGRPNPYDLALDTQYFFLSMNLSFTNQLYYSMLVYCLGLVGLLLV